MKAAGHQELGFTDLPHDLGEGLSGLDNEVGRLISRLLADRPGDIFNRLDIAVIAP